MYITDPTFQLFSAQLDKTPQELENLDKMYKNFKGQPNEQLLAKPTLGLGRPVALRWTLNPEWGFPRRPFKVYRRQPTYSQKDLVYSIKNQAVRVLIRHTINFSVDYYKLFVSCAVPKGQSIILTPGNDDVLMKDKAYKVEGDQHSSNQDGYTLETVLFTAPFISKIVCEGLGSVTSVAGITMRKVLKADDWQLLQTVGLPFPKNEVAGQGYFGDKQGAPHNLMEAEKAALSRLELGEKLFETPPSIRDVNQHYDDLNWEFPDPKDYLEYLKKDQLKLIQKCLENSDDSDPENHQVHYREKRQVEGLHQKGGNAETQAEVNIPVVQQTMLSVAHDNAASLGLGFGTYDFCNLNRGLLSKYKNAPVEKLSSDILSQIMGVEYMVVAEYAIRPDKRVPKELYEPFLWKGPDKKKKGQQRKKTSPGSPISHIKKPHIPIGVIRPRLTKIPKNIHIIGQDFSGLFNMINPVFAFAALNNEKPLPVRPAQVEAIGLRTNRPEKMDGPWTQAVKIRWPKSAITQGSAFATGLKPNAPPKVINDNYPFNKKAYHNLLAPVQKKEPNVQDAGDVGKNIISATEEPVPPYGSEKHHYFVGALDVFGRWSDWGTVPFTTKALPPQQPGILNLKLNTAPGTAIEMLEADDQAIPFNMEIEFGWDWVDRSASAIQLAGKFFNAGQKNPPPGIPNYFSLKKNDRSTSIITITFDQNDRERPRVQGPYEIFVMKQADPSEDGGQDVPSNELVRYKLIVPVTCDFPNGPPHKVAFAAYIRGLEKKREPVNEYSDWNPWEETAEGSPRKKKKYIVRFDDPRPPAVSNLKADLKFTALPDASNVARGELSWPEATNAKGYHVWEANEIGIRKALNKVLTETDAPLLPLNDSDRGSASLVERATQLKNLFEAHPNYLEACRNYFSRINTAPLEDPNFEMTLPGSSDILSLYRVSSVNAANIESKKSNCSFFAIPQLNIPNPPMLRIEKHKDSEGKFDGFTVKTVHTSGKKPAGYRIFRVRKTYLADQLGMKGLPVYDETDPDWEDTTISLIDGTTYQGKQIIDKTLKPSWRPFVYQAVAVGQEMPNEGRFSGISGGSPSEITYLPPDKAPSIAQVGTSEHNEFSSCFEVKTSAPFHPLDLGITRLDIYALEESIKRKHLGTFIAQESKKNTGLSLVSSKREAKELPRLERRKENLEKGFTYFKLCVQGKKTRVVIRITDPLGRASEIELKN